MKWPAISAAVFTLAISAASRGTDRDMWTNPTNLRLLGLERVTRSDFREGLPLLETAAQLDAKSAENVAALANAYHLQRRLDEAALQYARLLRLNPSQAPTPQQEDAVLRFAPRVFQAASDPFFLKGVAAVHHPREPMIAYHFLWEDDIDFPEDNDPCDHELMWIRYDRTTDRITDVITYFHGRLLRSDAAVEEAHRHRERPRVNVQWGKHGSLPFGWERLRIQANPGDIEKEYLDLSRTVSLEEYNRATWMKLRTEGRRLADHPLSQEWPRQFTGSWRDFVDFSREVDIRSALKKRKRMSVSEWNNAVLQQQFLPYNFRPKTEWPADSTEEATELRRALAPTSDPLHDALATAPALPTDFPPASLFKPETPRYPNVWFYAAESTFPTYGDFVNWLEERFVERGFRPDAVTFNEGAEIALSIERLQPWNSVSRLAHAHSLHVRFFWKRLDRNRLSRVTYGAAGGFYWRVAASIHYEVDHFSPLHADVEVCPFCGRTGGYAAKEGSLVERVHDPLGLELLLWGTVKGQRLRDPIDGTFAIFRPGNREINTEAVALVTLTTASWNRLP